MFPDPGPRLFALAPGVDFPAALVAGLRARLAGQPPEAMARVTLIVNTQRMRRRVTDLFTASGAGFLPRIRLVTELGVMAPHLPPAIPPLRRRLELAQLVAGLLAADPGLAPRSALYDLADSLAALLDEMQGEGVPPDRIAALDVSGHSAHWARTRAFMGIAAEVIADDTAPDAEARQRMIVQHVVAGWQAAPPEDPVIVAGSTASRGTTALLMRAVAGLPQGALVLPGFDFDMPTAVWDGLEDALTAEDHPQFRFRRLMRSLGLERDDVRVWHDTPPPHPQRNRLVSLALRPAPVTDQWLVDGPTLGPLGPATDAMTLIEAPGPRAEALAIALILRKAAEEGQTAALVTPDRGLTRQVAAALDRWGILPDDSAGSPLALSAPGRLLRHVARLFGQRLTAEALLTLLKHPLAVSGGDRGNHLRWTREVELSLRRFGPPFPDAAALLAWAERRRPEATGWAVWIGDLLAGLDRVGPRFLTAHVAAHRALAEALAAGPGGSGAGALWSGAAGESAEAAMTALASEAAHGGVLTPDDYADLLDAHLARREVREAVTPHPHLMIWGTIEARVQGADLVILGGLNDGIWPPAPPPDPWMNRQMRLAAGLLLPERRIGLSAHDFQQAIGARQVVLSRAIRNAEAETVPSRWLNRLKNLMGGLAEQGGRDAWTAMQSRGNHWLTLAARMEAPPARIAPATRPAPRPPLDVRPKALAVTGIKTLIRDPYAIYARHILRLRPVDPLNRSPDARLRGSVLHAILEDFVRERQPETPEAARARLLSVAARVMADAVPWPAARALWQARMVRAADHFLAVDAEAGETLLIEDEGRVTLPDLGFALTARPDRIDRLPDGRLHILDYKTGAPPTQAQQKAFDKQLLLEAAMAERGGFATLGPCPVARVTYVGLGSSPKIVPTEIDDALLAEVWDGLHRLIASYQDRAQGYAARRAVFETRHAGDYDHLARHGEWEMSDRPVPEIVGPEDAP